jgi:hypothetical protein
VHAQDTAAGQLNEHVVIARSPPAPARAARSGAALTAQEAQVARIPRGHASPSATLVQAQPPPGQTLASCPVHWRKRRGPAQLTIAGTQSPDQRRSGDEGGSDDQLARKSPATHSINHQSLLDARETT